MKLMMIPTSQFMLMEFMSFVAVSSKVVLLPSNLPWRTSVFDLIDVLVPAEHCKHIGNANIFLIV